MKDQTVASHGIELSALPDSVNRLVEDLAFLIAKQWLRDRALAQSKSSTLLPAAKPADRD